MTGNEDCVLTAFTRTVGKTGDITATTRSLVGQTLQLWQWDVDVDSGSNDPRINAPVPARDTPYSALIDPGVALGATALEQCVWYLETHPKVAATQGLGLLVCHGGFHEDEYGLAADELAQRRRERGSVIVAGGETLDGAESESARADRLSHPPSAWISQQVPFRNPVPKPKPRLLLVIPWMEVGGADRFNLNLLSAARDAGWDVTVVATLPGRQPWRSRFESLAADIAVLPGLIPLADQPRFLRYLLGSRDPDVVLISNSELGYRFLPYLRSVAADAAFIDYCHSDSPSWNNGGYPRLSVQFHGQLDLTLTASEQLRAWMIDRGSDPSRIRVAYVGVDVERFRPDKAVRGRVRAELGLDDRTPTVLFVGRVDEDKQPDVLVEALRLLAANAVDFYSVVAGSGPAFDLLRSLIRSRGLSSRTRLLGSVEPDSVADLMCAADVLVLPSRWEGIAVTLYEAMACGIPVVATDVGGHRELVTPDTGVLISRSTAAEEARALAKALQTILGDAGLRETMGMAARARASEFFPLAATTTGLFNSIAEGRRLHDRDPQPLLPQGAALAWLVDAVELLRLQTGLIASRPVISGGRLADRARVAVLAIAQKRLGGAYRWSATHDLGFVVPVKEAVVRILLPRARG